MRQSRLPHLARADQGNSRLAGQSPIQLAAGGTWNHPWKLKGMILICKEESNDAITLFKSIGMALSDLVGAGLVYKTAG
jgi:hypothetical protein